MLHGKNTSLRFCCLNYSGRRPTLCIVCVFSQVMRSGDNRNELQLSQYAASFLRYVTL